jgi:predicted RNA-binding Zn ribbon-like protein
MVTMHVEAAQRSGVGPFSFRSRRLALDFSATLMFRGESGCSRDLLTRPAALAHWVEAAGLLDRAPHAGPRQLEAARALREAIYRVALAAVAHHKPRLADLRLLNQIASGKQPTLHLTELGSLHRGGDLNSALTAIAHDAIDLLGGPNLHRLRQCSRKGCTRLFVDRSRSGNRRWCGMRECGNRVNASAYRRRRRQAKTKETGYQANGVSGPG